jgi:hypothetical protein
MDQKNTYLLCVKKNELLNHYLALFILLLLLLLLMLLMVGTCASGRRSRFLAQPSFLVRVPAPTTP